MRWFTPTLTCIRGLLWRVNPFESDDASISDREAEELQWIPRYPR